MPFKNLDLIEAVYSTFNKGPAKHIQQLAIAGDMARPIYV
jgi:hypothetical protein